MEDFPERFEDPLLNFAHQNERRELEKLIESGMFKPTYVELDVNPNRLRNNLVIAAVMGLAEDVLFYLKDLYPGVNYKNKNGRTACHYAVLTGSIPIATLVNMIPGRDWAVQDKHGRTPMHYAITQGDCSMVDFLSNYEYGPSVKDKKGETPKQLATRIHSIREILVALEPK